MVRKNRITIFSLVMKNPMVILPEHMLVIKTPL